MYTVKEIEQNMKHKVTITTKKANLNNVVSQVHVLSKEVVKLELDQLIVVPVMMNLLEDGTRKTTFGDTDFHLEMYSQCLQSL